MKYDNNVNQKYENASKNLAYPKGADTSKINNGIAYTSLINKLHLIKLQGIEPDDSLAYKDKKRFGATNFYDLCTRTAVDGNNGAQQYDAEDFLYAKNLGFPINKLITLRRFPKPVTDNIYDSFNQAEPDIARMITYYDQETNKLEELLSFGYGMKWKELTAEMEQASMVGDQSGFTGLSKKVMSFIDPVMATNKLRGENSLNYDPKHDQNKVYGPVDSITTTNIRDVGLEFTKEFDIVFEYELRSINGRTPEFAFKDLIANILATTYNNAKFWGGSRYWVGERPSNFVGKMDFMNPKTTDEFLTGAFNSLKAAVGAFSKKGSAIDHLKSAMENGFAMALGKILDTVGRPSILSMNSLLSGEPTGFWHLTIGNPDNPTMCIGNLLCTNVDFKFPTDSLSYGDFPTKLQVNVKLKPGQPKDKAGIETMFNMGRSRIYYNPKQINVSKNNNFSKQTRSFYGFDGNSISQTIDQTFDFVAENAVNIVTDTISYTQEHVNATTIDNSKQTNNKPNIKSNLVKQTAQKVN